MKYLKFLLLLLTPLNLIGQCVGVETFTISPPPVGGQYAGGTTLTICYELGNWNGLSSLSNWVEGFDINYNSNVLSPPSPLAPPANCDGGGGNWLWMNTSTSSNTGITVGPGWFFEVNQGGPVNGSPGDDWGDYGNCVWQFCFETTVLNTCLSENLGIQVTVGADGTWGSWLYNSCIPIPFDIPAGTNIPQNFESVPLSPLIDTLCVGETATQIVNNNPTSIYTPNDTLQNIWNNSGNYQVYIVEETIDGCIDTTWFNVIVLSLPQVNIQEDSLLLCENASSYNLTYGPLGGTWNNLGPIIDPQQSNSGWTYYTYEDLNNCTNIDSTYIQINESPSILIIEGPQSFVNCLNNRTHQYTCYPQDSNSTYIWIINGDTLYLYQPQIIVNFPNVDEVYNQLSVTEINELGCVGPTNTIWIYSEKCGEVFIPNSFSPDGDNINDMFKIITVSIIDNFELCIFNRWGDLIYTFKDQKDYWDGNNAQNGTYIYKFQGKIGDKRVDKIGHVNLIK